MADSTRSGRTRKVTITLPTEAVEALEQARAAGTIPSVSEYVAETVCARLDRERWLAEWRKLTGEPDPKAAAWADQVIAKHCLPGRMRKAS
ncbi:hypothetical protein TBS_30880 [Thermobispora bispora]|jgi:Arc/MetJ-type ribon-helix-helix transcriptional regulator|uniref:Ribbon-helix-helix protein CopG domain-containing protein n=1 Tax=Thermobispora bispora (strain ATCC 19993 / DSM 43833 / CBS 139.67 / JCM 10125 / KCTC 9307 / NBRC 14880 / R51) TaxID=469371 RepID=D6Y7M8_THEBD|nr:hypothetical protein [Thermobispora bispora]ADG89739.1 hypothetical protein Tbis_3043 [Thermobispora bispora DSM 43833]MBX6167623.1 hypothetical protein [Thermobispora bispora]QSI49926.1 hypothetical protein CYL17_18265 [Thermobispora bispora]QSI50028.1 hypothetical protein CYL17_18835 [Thermobispora bispora]